MEQAGTQQIKKTATNKLIFSRGDGKVLRAMMQALGDFERVNRIFPFQRSPEILGVSLIVRRDLARGVTESLFEMSFQGSMNQILIQSQDYRRV